MKSVEVLVVFFLISMVTLGHAQVLDIQSTTEGITIPRMTQAQRDAISAVEGELIYQTNGIKGFYYYDGAAWTSIAGGVGAAGSAISILHGGASVNGANQTDFGGLSADNRPTLADAEFALTRSGTLKNFTIAFTTAVDGMSTVTVSVLVNGAPVFSKAMAAGDGRSFSDLITSAAVSQGDFVAVKFESNGQDPTVDDPNFIYMTCSFELH